MEKTGLIFLGTTEPRTCEVCGAQVGELRRGRCWGCYTRWAEARPVGLGAACALCDERRRDNLRMIELLGTFTPLCHNCAHRATRLKPTPPTLAAIREQLDRERRHGDRRHGRQDGRVYPRERRGLERRNVGRPNGDDLMILEDADIEIIDGALEAVLADGCAADGEETKIRFLAE